MKTFSIIVYSDPGHAWGKVKRSILESLDIAQHISRYSYQYKDNVYLEEDVDLAILCNIILKQDTRIKFIEKTSNKSSKIRNYERYCNVEHGYGNLER